MAHTAWHSNRLTIKSKEPVSVNTVLQQEASPFTSPLEVRRATLTKSSLAWGIRTRVRLTRAPQNGARLICNPAALANHYARVTFAGACRNSKAVTVAPGILEKKEEERFWLELKSASVRKRGSVRAIVSLTSSQTHMC